MLNTVLNTYLSDKISEAVFPDNSFMSKGFMIVNEFLNGKTVEIPFYDDNAGLVTMNQTTFDFNDINQTALTSKTFSLDTYYLKPVHIEDFEESVTPFSKIDMVTRQSLAALQTYTADSVLKKLATDVPVGNIITTTGANGTLNSLNNLAAKKKLVYADLLALKKAFDKSDLAGERYLILDPEMFSDLLSDSQVSTYLSAGYASTVTGEYPKVLGINIIQRSNVIGIKADNSAVVSANSRLGDTLTNTDARCGFAFIADVVMVAVSEPRVYANSGVAQAYGSVVSAAVNFGAKNPRGDGKGVYLVKQG